MCESFNIQYNTNFISVMPTNLYGPGDNYNLEKSHVLPALLRKIHLGKCLEDGDMRAIQKDLEKNPVENVNGHSGQEDILNILEKYGVQVLEGPAKISTESKPYISQGVINKVVVNVWGTGTPLREFMYSPDMAAACVFVMENVEISDIIRLNQQTVSQTDYHPSHFLNIGTEEEVTIKELAERIKKLTGFKGEIVFDLSKPDGTMRKTVDVRLLKGLGYKHEFNLDEGLRTTYTNYLK
jgi:GDP-L-fucose synthase